MMADLPPIHPRDFGIGRLFTSIQDAVVAADVGTGRIVLWNAAATTIFGYTLSEALSLPLAMLVPERLREQHQVGVARFHQTGHGPLIDTGLPFEVPALRKGGEEFTIELSLSPITDAKIAGSYVLAIIRDVTDRKRLEEERARQARLDGALLAIRTAEHELLNQLAAISGYAELLQRDPALPEHLRDKVRKAVESCHGAAATLRLLQELARLKEIQWGSQIPSTIDLPGSGE